MEGSAIIVVIVIIIGIILAVIAISSFLHPSSKSATTTTTGAQGSTTTVPTTVNFYNTNVKYIYTGGISYNGNNCTYSSYEYTSGQAGIVNGSTEFYLSYQESSTVCPMVIYNVTVTTPGFTLVGTVPQLPFNIPASSSALIQLNIRSPEQNFYGPLSVTIYYTD